MSEEKFEGWAVLELMGHRRIGGYVREVSLAGAGMLRIEIPRGEGSFTQFYPPLTLYCMTPATEEVARAAAAASSPEPVHEYEVRRLPAVRFPGTAPMVVPDLGEEACPVCHGPDCICLDAIDDERTDPDRLHDFHLDESCGEPAACGLCGEDGQHSLHRRHAFEAGQDPITGCEGCGLPKENEIHGSATGEASA